MEEKKVYIVIEDYDTGDGWESNVCQVYETERNAKIAANKLTEQAKLDYQASLKLDKYIPVSYRIEMHKLNK